MPLAKKIPFFILLLDTTGVTLVISDLSFHQGSQIATPRARNKAECLRQCREGLGSMVFLENAGLSNSVCSTRQVHSASWVCPTIASLKVGFIFMISFITHHLYSYVFLLLSHKYPNGSSASKEITQITFPFSSRQHSQDCSPEVVSWCGATWHFGLQWSRRFAPIIGHVLSVSGRSQPFCFSYLCMTLFATFEGVQLSFSRA